MAIKLKIELDVTHLTPREIGMALFHLGTQASDPRNNVAPGFHFETLYPGVAGYESVNPKKSKRSTSKG